MDSDAGLMTGPLAIPPTGCFPDGPILSGHTPWDFVRMAPGLAKFSKICLDECTCSE